ncbi:hypothetical protein EON65_07015 [archaeon]|nr:MAG: hypothetical protein EON65_07015 [archaeon]
MLRQLSDMQAHREMFGGGTQDLRQQALLNSHRTSFDNECLSPTLSSKITRSIPKSPHYLRQFSNERMLSSSSAPYSSCDSSDCGEREDTLIFLPKQKGNTTVEQKISPRAIKRRGRKPKRSSENVLASSDKSDSEFSTSSDWADKRDATFLPKKAEDPSEDHFHHSSRHLKVARSMSYESDSSASNWGSPLQRSYTMGDDDGWLSNTDTQVQGVDLSDLDIDLRALLCETPAPAQVQIPTTSVRDTNSSVLTSRELIDDVALGENFDLTLSQLSCDMDDLHMEGDGKLDTCLVLTPIFEDEEDIFRYLDDMST